MGERERARERVREKEREREIARERERESKRERARERERQRDRDRDRERKCVRERETWGVLRSASLERGVSALRVDLGVFSQVAGLEGDVAELEGAHHREVPRS